MRYRSAHSSIHWVVGTTTCACLLSTSWLPGHNNPSPWWQHYRHKQEAGSEGRCPAGLADTVSVKHKGVSWTKQGGRREIRTVRRKSQKTWFFVSCLLHFFVIPPYYPPPHTSLCLFLFSRATLAHSQSQLLLSGRHRTVSTFLPAPFVGHLSTLPSPQSASPLHYNLNGCCGNGFI